MLSETVSTTLDAIRTAFSGVALGGGVSWREAGVVDDYGTKEERAAARRLDEKEEWQKLPDELLGDYKWQEVLSFMDANGLRFHLPACMCFVLNHYASSDSLIVDSTIYTLCHGHQLDELRKVLTIEQTSTIRQFLQTCLAIGGNWLDLREVPMALDEVWA